MVSTPKSNDSVRVSSFLMFWEEFVKHRCEFFRELFARIHCGLTPSGPGVALLAEDPRGSALLPPRPRASGGHSPSSGPRGWMALFAQHGGGLASSPGLWLWPGWCPSLSLHTFLSPSSLLTCSDPEQRNSLTPTSTGCMWGLVGASLEVTGLRSLEGCGPCAEPPGRAGWSPPREEQQPVWAHAAVPRSPLVASGPPGPSISEPRPPPTARGRWGPSTDGGRRGPWGDRPAS